MIGLSDMDEETLVEMHATFITDGNWDEKRNRVVRELMDADRILKAPTLQEAIDYFQSKVYYVDAIENFECFRIEDEIYDADYWGRKNSL